MSWRLARSLERLRAQVNAAVPGRKKDSDGTVGDLRHQQGHSSHNPDKYGVVRGMDITHDPKGGFDSYAFAEHLRATADKRVLYIISNYRIANPGKPWRKYTQPNPHDKHVHVSVSDDPAIYDQSQDWDIGLGKASVTSRVIAAVIEAITPAKPAALKVGSKGAAVKELQALLGIAADGDFGPFTEKAVRQFQAAHSLVVDGIVGSYTLDALKKAKANPVDPFDKVMAFVFEDEGGATVSPDEPGGISTYGVSRTAWGEYIKAIDTIADMKKLTKEQAAKFYREVYWNKVATDKPAGIRYCVFDWALNSGNGTVDDHLPALLTVDSICDARLAYLRTLLTWPKYGKGWTNRIDRVRQRAKTL